MFDVLTLNAISPRGLARLPRERYRVSDDSAAPDAILVRSFNLHDREIPATVRAIGRAGAGVNNIPVPAMSQRGIPVFNAPGANANAVKELVVAGLIIGCRHLCHAWDFARTLKGDDAALHKAVESGKKQFVGTEISGRTLGVIGLGAIGRNVATAASALGMHVLGFDPGLTVERAARLGSAVKRLDALDELLTAAEFLTVHVPLIDSTRHLISTDQIARMPARAVILNFAREGIIDERAVVTALDAGRLSAYVSDFPANLTSTHPRCVTFPHLGASTDEAEENCAIMVADEVRAFLEHGHIHNSVNFPEVELPRTSPFRVICAMSSASNAAATIAETIRAAGLSVAAMANVSRGDVSYLVADLDAQPSDDVMRAIAGASGVLMARRL
ncbi:MAG TPA: 3-phosphoglycerate dehydrogenase family protein [Vicinamibacterales bacterium]|nr:3-phosphoglycerate dehydrogenase family protein [Vicinamibacterales bacterium]